MSGLSGRNTKIAPSKLGCRLPFESATVGDGYASFGPCLVRQMTPEEIARYGPPKPRAEENPFRSRFRQAIKVSKSPEEAAELLGMTVGKLNQYLGANGLHPRWDKRKEEEIMPAIQMTEQEAREKLPQTLAEKLGIPLKKIPVELTSADPNSLCQEHITVTIEPEPAEQESPKYYEGSSIAHRFTPERIAQAEELLSREEYIRLKNEGVSDQKIIKDRDKFHYELLTALKKKWGVNIKLVSGPPKPQKKPVPPVVTAQSAQPGEILVEPGEIFVEPRAQANTSGLTIARALELRDELTEDMKSWDVIHRSIIQGIELSARVVRILETQRDIHQTALNRINEVFERTVLPL